MEKLIFVMIHKVMQFENCFRFDDTDKRQRESVTVSPPSPCALQRESKSPSGVVHANSIGGCVASVFKFT